MAIRIDPRLATNKSRNGPSVIEIMLHYYFSFVQTQIFKENRSYKYFSLTKRYSPAINPFLSLLTLYFLSKGAKIILRLIRSAIKFQTLDIKS